MTKIYTELTSIGISFSSATLAESKTHGDIEKTLLAAASHLSEGDDPKILSPILSWIKIHGERVNMERLKKLKKQSENRLEWLSLFASFGFFCGQTRWKLLIQPTKRNLANGPVKLAEAQVIRAGNEPWAEKCGFLIPKNSEPVDAKFVLSPSQLAKINALYRNRLIFGSSWRADIVTAIEHGAASPAEIVKISGSSYEPAHRVFNELQVANWF